jgi:hypothetical protein
MSYMMTVSGVLPPQSFAPIEFLPISKGQNYIAALETELSLADGTPLWFAHDGRTGTSHDFVSGAQCHYFEHNTIDGTLLLRLLEALANAGCVFRIWWASDQTSHYQNLASFNSIQELRSGVAKLVADGKDIALRYKSVA